MDYFIQVLLYFIDATRFEKKMAKRQWHLESQPEIGILEKNAFYIR